MPTTFLPPLPDGVTAEAEPLAFRPIDLPAFVHERGEPTTYTSACGWPYHLVEQADRFVAVFEFLDHIGVVVLRGPRDAILRVLEQARPDWRSPDIIALSQLWDED